MKIIGHRGAAGLVFENTIASINKAIDIGLEYIEIDVWKTIDNVIIVFHDAYLDRLTNEIGYIDQLSYEFIQQVRLKNGDKIPTLKEVVDIIQEKNVKLLVELKSEDAITETLLILKNQLPLSNFIIGSFFHNVIKKLKDSNPTVQTSIMFESVPILLDEYLNLINPDYITISIETYNQYIINVIKSQNRKLVLYTINTKTEFELASKLLPFAIVTNFPNLFIKI